MLIAVAAVMLVVLAAGAEATVGVAGSTEQATGTCDPSKQGCFSLESTIAFTSTRDNPSANPLLAAEIYLLNPDGTNPRRITNNTFGDAFPALSPDGKKIVFDSNRNQGEDDPLNIGDLFLMNTDGNEQTLLTGGMTGASSATWSPDSKEIAFHASASGNGIPEGTFPGAPTTDSDIFVANVDDLLAGVEGPRNITNNGSTTIDEDPDWSPEPDSNRIVYTRHTGGAPRSTSDVYVMNADGSDVQQLTDTDEDARGPSWSPDGARIVFAKTGGDPDPTKGGTADFEIFVMNADGTGLTQLTDNGRVDLTPSFSPDGTQIVFHEGVPGQGQQLFTMNADGTQQTKVTSPPGINNLANWGELRVSAR
jgi:TolB protein